MSKHERIRDARPQFGLSKSWAAMRPRYDVVIVGSGYGGGISASHLARAGKSVAVIERGREVLTGDFPQKFPDLRNEMRVRGSRFGEGSPLGLYDVRFGEDLHVLVGSGLGGGSLVNAGVMLRPDDRVFADPVWPQQLRDDGLLEEGYRRAAKWLRPSRDPEAETHTKFQALDAASDGVTTRPVAPTVAVSFSETINPAGVFQPACTRCGDCCAGCNVGAKNTVAQTYLPDAVAQGATCFTEISVDHISRAADGSWVVHLRPTDPKSDASPPTTVTADQVVLAAGALGSTEILLRSKARGLPVSDALGTRFSANGDIIAFGYGADQPVNAIGVGYPAKGDLPPVGAAVSGQIEIDDPDCLENEMRIQEGVLPSAMAPVLPVMFVPNGRLLGALKSLINGVYQGPLASLQTFFAVSHDSASGRAVLDDDNLKIEWPGVQSEPVYERLDRALEAIVGRIGGDYVKNPLAGSVMGNQPATAHPLGGCPMGEDAQSGVVDHASRVFDAAANGSTDATLAGLYVIDGSIIPRSLGVNPLFTISALSERAMIYATADITADTSVDA